MFLDSYQKTYAIVAEFYTPGAIAWCVDERPKIWQKVQTIETQLERTWGNNIALFKNALGQIETLYKFINQERAKAMPVVDFNEVDNPEVIPKGKYPCVVAVAKLKKTKKGDEMFCLKLEVLTGEYKCTEIWDNLIFSKAAMPRVKQFCTAVGIDTDGVIDITSEMITGQMCLVNVVEETDNFGQAKNSVDWDGYNKLQDDAPKDSEDDGNPKNVEVPF